MPNKKVDDLKNDAERAAGQEWQKALDVPNLTTRELDYMADKHQGSTLEETRQAVLDKRSGK